jgi:hypothetical protein
VLPLAREIHWLDTAVVALGGVRYGRGGKGGEGGIRFSLQLVECGACWGRREGGPGGESSSGGEAEGEGGGEAREGGEGEDGGLHGGRGDTSRAMYSFGFVFGVVEKAACDELCGRLDSIYIFLGRAET